MKRQRTGLCELGITTRFQGCQKFRVRAASFGYVRSNGMAGHCSSSGRIAPRAPAGVCPKRWCGRERFPRAGHGRGTPHSPRRWWADDGLGLKLGDAKRDTRGLFTTYDFYGIERASDVVYLQRENSHFSGQNTGFLTPSQRTCLLAAEGVLTKGVDLRGRV